MFKFESYITPILLSHVQKYVKNVEPPQSQLSLWGGELKLENLDLRLEVLEQELRLPFTLVSGHIHELEIQVPWTRLQSEPIQITINTIECVLKLPSDSDKTETGSSSSSVTIGSSGRKDRRQSKKSDAQEAPPGYIQSLINKIISNITIVCNNLILKYVEEDIVLSLNVRNLKVSSANEIWEPAFTELSLPELIMRKLLKITDMTICLDKRNASGKIDTYQEPLLYRCSLSVHAAWCYDSLHSKIPSVSRFEVKCPKLDFSLTDTQIPMFMRIVNLLLALYYGEVVQKSRRKIVDSAAADVEEGEGGFDDHGDGERDSWGGWAWNVGTSVGTALLPIYWEDEEGEGPNAPKVDVKRDKVVHFAAFIDSASLVFKLTEHQTVDKSMFGSMKLCFTPFARMDCNGIFSELIVKGIGLVNVAGGVSEIILAPTGHCLCGVSDTKSNGDPENPFVQCGQPGQKKYLKGSLFEKDFGSETGGPPKERQKSYKIDWESHMESVTEDNMLERSPAVAVDYMYVLDIPNDYSSEQLSEIGFDLEYSNLSERALCRFVFGPSRLNVCSGLIHRVQTLVHFGSMYDYPPYKITPLDVGERVNEAPTPEEVDRLQHETPLRVYQLTAINPTVYVYAADHPLNLPLKSLHMRPSYPIKALALEFLPGIIVKMECLDSQFSHPMYPYRIVSATAALKNPPANLMQKCHSQFTTKVMQVSAHIFNGDQSTTLIQPSNFQIGLKTLQLPEIWNNELLVKKDYHFDLTTFKVKLTRPQTLVLSHILQSQFQKNPVPLKISETSALEDALTKRMSSFVFQVSGVRLQLSLTDHIQTIQATVENVAVNMFVVSKDQSGHSSNILPILSRTSNTFGNSGLAKSPLKMSPGRAHTRNDDLFFSIHAQFPRKSDHQQVPSLLVGHISHIDVNLDPKIVEWYFYFPTPKTLASATPSKPIQREVSVVSSTAGEVTVASDNAIFKSSTLSDSKAARKSKSPSPFVGKETKSLNTGTSEKQTVIPMGRKKPSKTSAKPGPGTMISDWFPTLNSLLIQIKIDGHHIYLPQKSLVSIASKTVAETIQKSLSLSGQYPLIGISLPSITLENVAHKPVVQQFLSSFPISLPEGVWNIERDNLPWTLKLSDFSIFSHNESKLYMLDHVSTSCTLALKVSKTKSAPKTLPQNLSLTIHTDMSPIKFELSETQLQLLISLTEDAIGAMAKLNPSILVSNSSASSAEINVKSPMSSPEGSSTGISATRPIIDTMSDTPTSQYVGKSGESGETETGSTVSLWIQWTVPLISCALITKNGSEEIKIKMDMEDCQSSFDWTPIYFKMKSRVLAANIRCKVRKKEADWEDSANKGIVLSCSDDLSHEIHFVNAKNNNIEMLPHSRLLDSDTSVFNFTFTRAECSNVKRKWKDLIRKNTCQILEVESEERPRFLCEIDMKLAPFDVVISPPEIIPFVRMMSHVVAIKIPKALFASPPKSTKSEMIGLGLNNNTLPRVYLRAKTIRVFLLSSYVNEESHLALSPDFLLLQLDSCNITPQVENPLSRILIRPEIYHMATPMLSLPGAHIEDRQYMITFTGIGVFTGRWHDMLKKSEKPPKPLLKTMGENPALEWNTTKELTDQQLAMEVLLLPCLSKFDLAVTMAPAIVLMQHKNGASVQKLIAGHAIEINATQDIAFFLSLCQIKLISLLTKECIENIKYVYQKLKTGSKGVLDSGVDCDASSQSRVGHETSQIQKKTRFVPTEMLITGSKITCSLFKLSEEERGATRRDRNMWRKYRYKHRRKEIMEERGQVTEESDGAVSDSVHHEVDGGARREGHSKSREDFGYEASEEGSIEELHETIKIYPLMYLSIQQPHIFLSCAKANQKLDISFYDAGLNLSPPEYFITCGGKRLPEIMDYPTKWFQSRQGDVNPKSGIPPALFTATIANFITKPCSLSITLERPLKFEVGLDLISQLTSTIDLIKESSNVEDILALISSSNDECGPKYEIRSGSTLKEDQLTLLRRQFSSLASICFSTKQIVMHCPISSSANCIGAIDLLGGIMGLNINVKLQSKWKNGGAELDLIKTDVALDKLLIRLGIGGIVQNFIAPWSCTLVSSVYWLPQSPLPVVSLSISSGAVNIKCGPNHIIAIKSLLNQRDPAEDSKSEKIGKGQDQSPEEVCTDTEPSGGDNPTEQAYSDDLRAGAFQYITSGSSDDPKPYQVVFSSSPPSMTWKYPQPRTLTRVTVYPVPFMSASESGSCNSNENTEGVSCALQFWDNCLGNFQTYSEFSLSETNVSHLNLPTIGDKKRCAVSSTWRVVLYYDDEDSEYQKVDQEVIVTPKSLVSVIKVDSYFNSSLIQRFQASISFPMITIELYNQLHFYGRRLPKDLRPFVLNPNFPLDQLFATITLESSLIGLDAWFQDWNLSDVRTNLKLKSCLSTTFTDFAFLASHHLIYPTKFQGTLSYCRKSTENTLDVHVHSKPFNIKFGHFANHTLTCASNLWSSVLSTDNDQIYDPSAMRNRNLEPITHFIVCNNTQEPIRFGQADTEENHLLKTQECHMYAWRSHKARLLLRICLEGGYWTWCEPFSLSPDKDSSESTVIRSIDHGSHKVSLVITLRRLKPTQVQVIVSGILSVGSLLKDHLELRVIHKLKEIDPPVPEQRSVLGSFSASPSFIVQDEKTQCVKIRLLGIGTPWSGEIPLLIDKGRKKSVLVRIPTKEKGQCLTIWCRIVEEKHGLLTRYLILFSPMYMARSLLPNPMNVVLTVPNTKNPPIQIELPGKELPVQLETLGPSDQKYQIAFKVVDTLPPSEPIPMSWGIIEQVREKQVDDQIGIDQIIREIPTFGQYDCEKRWPYIEDIPAKICWATNDQPKTDVQVNFTQYHPLCNTLCVEVNPWCLIVNQSGIGLLLKDEYNFVFNMANDSVFVPPQLNNSFYLGIADHEGEMAKSWFSPPLQLSEQEWRFHQLMPSVQGMIPKQGVVHTKILLDGQICFLTIQSKNEHGMRIIHIKPTFNITNQTGQTIRVAPLSVNRVKNKISADKIDFVSQDIFNDSDTAYRLLFWQMIGELGKNQVFDGFQHISLSTESSEWSLPLNMEDCRNLEEDKRKAVFIPKKQLVSCEDQDGGSATTDNGFANIPVILTCHQRNGQIYLVLSKDENPMLVIHNNLSASLRYGQALKNFRPEDIFVSTHTQLLNPCQSCYFSMPWMLQNFPFKDGLQEIPGLALSLSKSTPASDEADWIVIEESSQWSGKIDLSFQHEEFLNLPGHGDIKAIVEQVGHTIHVFVEPVSRIEFSAKDIRSRIAYEFDQENKGSESPALNRTDEGKCAPGIEESFATVVEESMSSEQSFVSVLQSPDTISKSTTENQTGLATKYHSMVDDGNSSRQFHQRPKLEIVYNVFIEELSLALSDDCNERENERDEFLRITLDAILLSSRPEYHFAKTLKVLGDGIPKFTNVTVCVYNIQIDNQMFNRHPFEFPLILVGKNNDARTRVPHSYQTEQLLDELRESSLIVVKLQFDSNGDRAALKTVKIQSAPLCAFIEDKFAYKLISVLASFQQPSPKSLGNSSNQSSEPTVISEDFKQPLPPEIRMASSNMINHLRLDEISVEAFDVSLSVHASIKMYIGLDQSPLNFSQFYRSNLFTTNYCLGQMLARHYISGALFRAGWVVGSLDLIGSPAGFTRTLGDGLKDFVSLPYQGIMLGPWAFLGGMASGSSSLLKHVSAGTLTSMTNFASSVSRNLDRLSLDQEHCQRNEVFRREKPQGLGQGLVNGLSGVGISLLGAVGGIAHHPINALLEQGLSPTGFVGGITKGLVGVVTKPLGGAAEFVAQTGQGLLHGTGWSKNLKPRYPAIPDHSCTFYSGNLKFSWKLIAGSNLHDTTVLFMVDVMYGSTQATLVLTPEALFIISAEEDAQEAVFHINELDCLESKDDPTKFTICIKSPGDPSGDGEAGTSVKDRITQFVLDTGVHCTVSDIEESDTCPDESNSVSPAPTVKEMPAPSVPTTGSQGVVQLSNKQEFTFYSSPLLRTTFIGLFQLVRRQINHKGFDMLS